MVFLDIAFIETIIQQQLAIWLKDHREEITCLNLLSSDQIDQLFQKRSTDTMTVVDIYGQPYLHRTNTLSSHPVWLLLSSRKSLNYCVWLPAVKSEAEIKFVHDKLITAAKKNNWSIVEAAGPPMYNHTKSFKDNMCSKSVGHAQVGKLLVISHTY